MPLTKADLIDIDFLDSYELRSDGSVVYLTVAVVSTTTGTKVVVVGTPADGEGIQTSRDHPVEVGDFVVITGTSGGLGNGTFTVASITNDTTFVVVEAIGTSTGGSVDFKYPVGASRIGFNPAALLHTTSLNVQDAIKDLDAAITASGVTSFDFLLVVEPPAPNNNYSLTRTGGQVTQEVWKRVDTTTIKSIDYTYTSGKVTTEVRKVFAANGITITAQATLTYTYSGSLLTSYAWSRDV